MNHARTILWSLALLGGLITVMVMLAGCSEDSSGPAEIMTPVVMLDVDAGWFEMGALEADSVALAAEKPRHQVYLSAYRLGKYEVTNGQYAEMLNWANAQGLLENMDGSPYTGGDIYAYGKLLMQMTNTTRASDWDLEYCMIKYVDGAFFVTSTNGQSRLNHPVTMVSWYGSAAFCNWLSEREGLTPAYDTATWALLPDEESSIGGYHLLTSAQFERASCWEVRGEANAALPVSWDTMPDESEGYHWRYPYRSDTPDETRSNIGPDWNPLNPMHMSCPPLTVTVGFYDGMHGEYVDSPSPVGAYDMGGNVWEWCNDWNYTYTSEQAIDPSGPATGGTRVFRGGSMNDIVPMTRSTHIVAQLPNVCAYYFGFRIAQ